MRGLQEPIAAQGAVAGQKMRNEARKDFSVRFGILGGLAHRSNIVSQRACFVRYMHFQ